MAAGKGREPFRERARRLARVTRVPRLGKRALRRLGFDVIRRHYYSPIPDLERTPPEALTARSELRSVDFPADAGLDLVSNHLAPHLAEYRPPTEPTGRPRDFYLDNGFYERVDAEMLYAMVRHLAPPHVVELGFGMSSLVIADARERNGDTAPSGHAVFDPFPREDIAATLAGSAEIATLPATEIPLERFTALDAGDLLFVDTTHTVKLGGDVNRIVLDVLPVLAPGVIVHFHDIFLPWEYPPSFYRRGFFWQEQYLLQAFLAFNDRFEVMLATHALDRMFPEEVGRLVPSAPARVPPSSFWLRRVDGR
jgi:hypothetical protein